MSITQLLEGILGTVSYGLLGTLLMALGFLMVDLVTPGQLRRQIWQDGNHNLSILLAAGLLGVGFIVVSAILTSEDGLLMGLLSTLVFGVIGLLLMALSFVLLDVATPGNLGEIFARDEPHPAVWVSAASHLAIGGIIAAAVT